MTAGFGFALPYPAPGSAGEEESSLRAAPGRGPRRGRILVMDDDRMMRDVMRRHLAVFGFEADLFAEGQEAVSAYARAREEGRPFDGVILDLAVDGGWGGERTLGELRALDPDVKAMVCSGSLEATDDQYRRQGFAAVLAKPYSLGEFRQKLETLVG